EAGLKARTLQLKLRYQDFSTFTRAHSIEPPTDVDTEIAGEIRRLFRTNWTGGKVRLLGVHAGNFAEPEQRDLWGEDGRERWSKALSAADRLRDKYGDSVVGLAGGMRGSFKERTHEALPERPEDKKD